MHHLTCRLFGTVAILVLALNSLALAQTGDADITGVVKDPSGSAVAGASLKVTNQDTGVSRAIVADAEGRYRFYPLPPGHYTLHVEMSGFKAWTQTDIPVSTGATIERDVVMAVGSVQESVDVTATAIPIDTTKTDVSGVVNNQQMESLPVNTRQYLNLALLMPGTSQDSSRTFYNSVQMGGSSHYWSNGFTVDGVTNTWAEMGEPRQNFPKGAVEEFKVNTVQYSADKGLSAGGVISIVTKSGTNQFHGEAFEYARDEIFNHDNDFDKAAEQQIGISKKPFRRNQFGGSVGGPIVKNKLHFYAAFERTQTTDSYTIYTGTTGHQYYSALEGVHEKPIHDQMINARGDYQITDNQHLFGRYSQEWNLITYNGCGGASMAACYDGLIPRHSIVIGHTWTASAHVVNEARFQYAYSSYQLGPSGAPIFTQMGVYPPERIAPLQTQLNFPSFSYGFGYADVGVETRWQWKDDLTYQKGKHSLKFGFDVSRIPFGDDAPNQLKGTYTFAHDHVFNPNDPATLAALAASNDATQFTATLPPIYSRADTTVLGLYAQDEWKLRRNFTLSLGLRWDRQFGSFNESLDPTKFAFNGVPITIPYVGDPGKRGSRLNFGPRIGLAWDVTGKARDVVRAGYGIYYQNLQTLQNFPELRNLAQCAVLIRNPAYPDPYGGQSPSAYCSGAAPTVTILDPDYRNAYSQQFNAGYSRQLANDFFIHFDGAYSRTLRDYRTVDLNYPINGVRPFAQFARILDHAPIGHANYKALYVRAEKRFARRYQFLVSYSLASNRDDSPEAQITNPANYKLDWGPAGADRRHNLVASGSALLPAKFTFGAVWTVRSTLPFSALSNTLDVDGIRQYVPGTTRNQGNRDLDMALVNSYRASLGLPAIDPSTIDSSRYNSFDIMLSRPIWMKEHKRLELGLQVFNLFGTQNLGVPAGQLIAGGNITNATSPSFGKIQGAFNLQQAELSARFAF